MKVSTDTWIHGLYQRNDFLRSASMCTFCLEETQSLIYSLFARSKCIRKVKVHRPKGI